MVFESFHSESSPTDTATLELLEGLTPGAFVAEDQVNKEQSCAADDGTVGKVEVWPHVVANVEVEEVGNASEKDSVVEIADGSAENEG